MTSGNARRVDGVNASPMDNPLPPPSVPAIDRPAEVHGISSSSGLRAGTGSSGVRGVVRLVTSRATFVDTESTTKLAVIRRRDE